MDNKQIAIEQMEAGKKSVTFWTLVYLVLIILTLPTLFLPVVFVIIGAIHTSRNKRHNDRIDLAINRIRTS
jgi:hypothetical protein